MSDYAEEWDLDGPRHRDRHATGRPTLTVEELPGVHSTTDELYELLMGEATGYYEQREEELGDETSCARSSAR